MSLLAQCKESAVLLVDKPISWTSFDVIKKIRNKLRIKKVGHAGTLDPLATGLLIICTGKSTKQIDGYQAQEKEYTGTFTLGATTPTYDLESEPENFKEITNLDEDTIRKATLPFTGLIDQFPPAHSAVKIDGKRAYLLARAGKDVEMKVRQVMISEFEITGIRGAEIDFRVVCSKGTYIRSLAHDFGQHLGCGAYLSALRRTRIGEFRIEDARDLEELIADLEHDREAENPQ
jgi:tRNA pseudouridine55 synthase